MVTPNMFVQLGDDTKMIQAAVDAANEKGDVVIISKYNERTGQNLWEINESIRLYSGSTVYLEGCHIRLADGSMANFFTNSNAGLKISKENRQKNISIIGRGEVLLDGGIHNGIFEYSFFVYDDNGKLLGKKEINGFRNSYINIGILFINVEGITLQNLNFVRQRYWCVACFYCQKGYISGLDFDANDNVPCQDGVDLRCGCSNFLVENITGNVGDDSVALTAFREYKEQEPEYSPDIHDITIRTIRTKEAGHCDTVRLLCRDGIKIYNVVIEDIHDLTEESKPDGKGRPLAAVRIGDLNDYGVPLAKPGEVYGITVRNVTTRARFGLYIANTLIDSLIENVMVFDDGGFALYANGCYMENVTIRDVRYAAFASQPIDFYLGYKHIHHKVMVDKLSGMYFANCDGKHVRIYDFTAGRDLTYAFAGHGNTLVPKVVGTVCLGEQTLLTDGMKVEQ